MGVACEGGILYAPLYCAGAYSSYPRSVGIFSGSDWGIYIYTPIVLFWFNPSTHLGLLISYLPRIERKWGCVGDCGGIYIYIPHNHPKATAQYRGEVIEIYPHFNEDKYHGEWRIQGSISIGVPGKMGKGNILEFGINWRLDCLVGILG